MILAVIFDLDGTVLDNEEQWEEAFRMVAEKTQNLKNSKSQNGWMHERGIGIAPNWRRYVGDEAEVARLARETRERYWEQVGDPGNLKVREGIEDLVALVKQKGWLTALCTGSNWDIVEKELEALNLYLAFDVTTTGEEVSRPKPDPEIYLWTAQKLGVEPQNCVVIEDAEAGIRAAKDAGMRVFDVRELAQAQKWFTMERL